MNKEECGKPPALPLRGGQRPTWRPEREARGSALGVQSREGTYSLHRLPIKTYDPIASVAALSERHADWQVIGWHRRPCRLPDLSLRGGQRPTWRPEREARGSALGVQSREGTADLERLSLKWYVPIASVAAVTAQPLAALPPYGCGVPLAGSDRPVRDYSTAGGHWCTTALPDVSLRGRFAPVAISRTNFRIRRSCPVIHPGPARLHPKGTSSRCALRAPRRPAASSQ